MADVTLYTRQFCGYCTAARRLLDKKGVAYRELDATFSQELRQEMIQRSGGRTTFPQIFIDDGHIGGCDELHMLEHSGRLDKLLLPAV